MENWNKWMNVMDDRVIKALVVDEYEPKLNKEDIVYFNWLKQAQKAVCEFKRMKTERAGKDFLTDENVEKVSKNLAEKLCVVMKLFVSESAMNNENISRINDHYIKERIRHLNKLLDMHFLILHSDWFTVNIPGIGRFELKYTIESIMEVYHRARWGHNGAFIKFLYDRFGVDHSNFLPFLCRLTKEDHEEFKEIIWGNRMEKSRIMNSDITKGQLER